MTTNDVVFKGKTMLSTIDYARACGVSPAYPDSSVAEVVGALVAEVEKLGGAIESIRDIATGLGRPLHHMIGDILAVTDRIETR